METNNSFQSIFTTYQPIENPTVKIEMPLMDNGSVDISDWASSVKEDTPIVKSNLPKMIETQTTTSVPQTTVNVPTTNEDLTKISFEELIKQENIPARITSGYRGKGSLRGGKTAQGRRSNHNRIDQYGRPMAYDIAPLPGHTFDDLKQILYKNPRVVNWFRQRKWGILEEMQDGKRGFYDLAGKFHYTGATGPHLHLGPDTYGVENYNSKISLAQQGMKFKSIFTEYQPIEIKEEETPNFLNLPLESFDISRIARGVSSDGTIIAQNNLPHMIEENSSSQQVYTLDEASSGSNESYKGYPVPKGDTVVNITEDQLGAEKDTGESYTLNPSTLLGNTILNSSASRRGNNPLSISHSNSDVGYSGSFKVKDGQNFASYNSVVDGLASAMRLYKRKYNNRSVRGINDGYQGYYHLTKNNKALTKLRLIWITNISKQLGIDPTKKLNLDDKETMFSLMAAIAKQESSSTLSRNDLEAAWKKAFG